MEVETVVVVVVVEVVEVVEVVVVVVHARLVNGNGVKTGGSSTSFSSVDNKGSLSNDFSIYAKMRVVRVTNQREP